MIPLSNRDLINKLVDYVVEMSINHVHEGGIPFTALIADRHGTILGSGVNQVKENHDPTAHAEIMAIRNACQKTQRTHLRGTTLIASGEPCAMCYLSAIWSGIDQVIYAVDRDAAADAGFDYRWTYRLLTNIHEDWPFDVQGIDSEEGLLPFELWNKHHQ